MGGSAPKQDEASRQLEESELELDEENKQKIKEAELKRVQMLKRTQGDMGIGNVFSGSNKTLG